MTTLTIDYFNRSGNAGHLSLDLSAALPAKIADFKRVLSFLQLSTAPDDAAKTVHSYIAEQVEQLQSKRAELDQKRNASEIVKINNLINAYVRNASALVSVYTDLAPIKDAAPENVPMKKAAVYSLQKDGVKKYSGWAFAKLGYTFDVYKADAKYYKILLHGTGLKVAECTGHNLAPLTIDKRIIDALNSKPEYIARCKENFHAAMVKAGYIEPDQTPEERRENISTDKQPERRENIPKFKDTAAYKKVMEAETMKYKKDKVIVDGVEMRAEYELHYSGAIYVHRFTGFKRITSMVDVTSPAYPAALEACKASNAAQEAAADPAPVPVDTVEHAPATTEQPAKDPKAAHGPVPEKKFIGQRITGAGWVIFFDPATERTRVIFQDTPSDAAKAAVEGAGFYYSGKMDSWNKKLTFRAYRAAQKLSEELNKICAA